MAAFGTMPTQRVHLTVFLTIIQLYLVKSTEISDLRKCGDKLCTVTLSRARAMARYPAKTPLHLSLNSGDIIEVKSKSAGNRPDLWGGEVNGQKGYFPKSYVKEFEVKIDKPMFEVATEKNEWSKESAQRPIPPEPTSQQPNEPPPSDGEETLGDETENEDLGDIQFDEPQDSVGTFEPDISKVENQPDQAEESEEATASQGEEEKKEAFNNFLSKQFASSPKEEKPEEADSHSHTEEEAAAASDVKVPDFGPGGDEAHSDKRPPPGNEDTEEGDEENDGENLQEEEGEESPYIDGVRPAEEEEEKDEDVKTLLSVDEASTPRQESGAAGDEKWDRAKTVEEGGHLSKEEGAERATQVHTVDTAHSADSTEEGKASHLNEATKQRDGVLGDKKTEHPSMAQDRSHSLPSQPSIIQPDARTVPEAVVKQTVPDSKADLKDDAAGQMEKDSSERSGMTQKEEKPVILEEQKPNIDEVTDKTVEENIQDAGVKSTIETSSTGHSQGNRIRTDVRPDDKSGGVNSEQKKESDQLLFQSEDNVGEEPVGSESYVPPPDQAKERFEKDVDESTEGSKQDQSEVMTEPSSIQPKSNQADTKQVELNKADAKQLEVNQVDPKRPESNRVNLKQPESNQADPQQPKSNQADSKKPELNKADTKQPEPIQAHPKQPETKQVDTTQPESNQVDPNQLNTQQSGFNGGDPRQPIQNDPEFKQPSPNQPVPQHSDPKQAESKQPHPDVPVLNLPGSKEPEHRQAEVKQAEINQLGSKQPVPNQPGFRQPDPNQPGFRQPDPKQPGSNQPNKNQQGLKSDSGLPQQGMTQAGVRQPDPNQPASRPPNPNQPGFKPDPVQAGFKHPDPSQPDSDQTEPKRPDPIQPRSDQQGSNQQGLVHPIKGWPQRTAPQEASQVHQPVDIDFKAEAVHGGIPLESSYSPSHSPVDSHTPALQATPGLQEGSGNTPLSQVEDRLPTTEIGGTRFYLVDGEPADIVPESVEQSVASEQVEMSAPPPVQATQTESTQSTLAATPPPSTTQSGSGQHPAVDAVRSVQEAANRSETNDQGLESLGNAPADPEGVGDQNYDTTADFLSRKVLSVKSQVPTQAPPPKQEEVPRQEQGIIYTTDAVTPASDVSPPSSIAAGAASVTTEQAESLLHQFTDQEKTEQNKEEEARKSAEEKNTENSSPSPEPQEGAQTNPPDASRAEDSASQRSEGDAAEKESGDGSTEVGKDSVTGQEAEIKAGAGTEGAVTSAPEAESPEVPAPPTGNKVEEEPTLENDAYQMDHFSSRKINDDEISKQEDAAQYEPATPASTVVGSIETQSRGFINKLPPSIQSLLEHEPLGLSPSMTVLVTATAFAVFLSLACFSFVCSGGRQAGKKDALVVVRELEQKLLMAVKEKENLEDQLNERQSETDVGADKLSKRLRAEKSELQNRSDSADTDLQNVTLHNEVLKNQISSLQEEISELRDTLSRKSNDVKVKDKKSKDYEKETKKLQESKHRAEQELHKKCEELQRVEDENENLKTAVQSLTDQVELLDTSKQQLLSEAEDWKEKVDELKEASDQLEQQNRQAQETISFKDNELEMMKDCYQQLKAFEKEDGEDTEDMDTTDAANNTQDIQEKIAAMIDVSKVNATLRAVQKEKDNLENKLKIENDARRELEEQLECVRREMESSMADKMKAERQCQESLTKLNVLSSYFKDKELQLQRELGEQEALKKQNLSKLDNADETKRSLHKELELSKQQVESLKRELTASERDFRSQIAANEKKAHENWLNARAAERELKESRHEAAVLRQKLTDTERKHMVPGLIRPLPTRGMPGELLNGPPPPPPGLEPPGGMPPRPPFREGFFAAMSPREREQLPPSHPARHMPGSEARSPPPRLLPPDSRGSPPRMMLPDARSPPPYDRRGPPHPLDTRSPPLRGPLPPHMPPMRSPGPRMDSPRGPRQEPSPYGRQPPQGSEARRHQSQV